MNLFSLIGLSISILCTILSLGIFRYAKNKTHYLWAIFNLFVAAWAFWSFRAGMSSSSQEAILNWKLSYIPATFISVVFYHLTCSFCRLKRAQLIQIFYIQGIIFVLLIFYSNYFVASTHYIFNSLYYHQATFLFTLWLILWSGIAFLSFCELYKFIKKTDYALERIQALFLFWGMIVGFVGGVSTAIPAYNIPFYPIWQSSVCLYVIILAYAIIRYNFLEVRIIFRVLMIPSIAFGILSVILTYIFLDLSIFSLASLSLATSCLLLAFLVFAYSKQPLHRIWSFFNFAVFSWAMGTFFAGISKSPEDATIAWRWAYGLGPFVPSVFYHFVYLFCELKKKNTLRAVYLLAVLFVPINFFAPHFINEIVHAFGSIYYHKATTLFTIFMAYLGVVVFLSFKELIQYLKIARGNKRAQTLYILYGFGIGWGGGVTTFLPPYNVPIYPAWHFTICIYTIIMTYAILKYQIMDIEIVGARVGIFVLVYSLVLGIPFYYAYSLGLWKQALWLMMILATTGPFIYLFLQKKAEDQLLIEQNQYQTTLKQASLGMGQIKDLGRLLKLIVHIVTRVVEIEHSEVYLFHEDSKQYTLKASRGWTSSEEEQVSMIAPDSSLVQYLKKTKEPILYEEIEQYAQGHDTQQENEIKETIRQLDGSLVVPSFMDQKLIAILVLGSKKSGKIYTEDDIAVFSILANQAGLAIENAQFYEKMKETHVQLLKAEKMATVGTMADGLSHQINNRLHAMGFIAGDMLDTIKLKKKGKLSADMKEFVDEIGHSLERIEDNVRRGGEIVEGLLKYTRRGSEGFEPISLNKLLDASLEMVQFKIKISAMNIVRSFDDSIPMIKGNFTQLQEVFFNLIDNAYDAMMERKEQLKESGYKAKLIISAKQVVQKLEILIQDNGIGVKNENFEKLFTPFFTTKLSSKKGTGLGLYVIRQVIEENHGGKVKFASEYRKGSQTSLLLPIVDE